jgi:hypothetical protein
VRLFQPRDTYRFVRGGQAFLTYSLQAASKGPVPIDILDAQGGVIRKLEAPGNAGIDRMVWDLRYDPPRMVALRTPAPDNPHIWDEPRFRDQNSRPITHWGIAEAEVGPIVAPGKYSVRLTANGQTVTQPIMILPDPHSPGTPADIDLSVKTLLRIRDDISKTADMVNQIEWMRKQIEDVEPMLAGQPNKADLLKTVQQEDQRMQSVEYSLIARTQANSDDKYYVEPYKVYLNLIWLNGEVGTGAGDVNGAAAFAPTETDLAAAQADYHTLMNQDVPKFNRSLAEQGITPLVAVTPGPPSAAQGGAR